MLIKSIHRLDAVFAPQYVAQLQREAGKKRISSHSKLARYIDVVGCELRKKSEASAIKNVEARLLETTAGAPFI